jgi:polysaccharide biosynthesis protein PelG
MAGIGFALRDLRRREGLFGPAILLGHGAIVAAGPWIFTVLSIAIIRWATATVLASETAYTLQGFVIYGFALSLLATAPIVNVAIRHVADDIFLGNFHEVQRRYMAALMLSGLASAALATGVFAGIFGVSGINLLVGVASTMVVGLIWPTLAFCAAGRDYSGITTGFVVGLLISVTGTVWGAHSGWNAARLMMAFTAGLGVVFFWLASRVLTTFPHAVVDLPSELARLARGIVRYWVLALGSGMAVIALWIDKWIMWFGPHGVALDNGLVSAPIYDGAMFVAYLVIIPAVSLFVTSIEASFFEAYRSYYRTIRDRAPLARIRRVGNALEQRTYQLISPIFLMQAVLCVAIALAAPAIVQGLGLQFQQIGILRMGLLAALFQFLFLACTSLLVFFDLHARYLALQVLFLISQISFTLVTIEIGPEFYGYGHLVACAIGGFAAVLMINLTFQKLEYLTFASALRQALSQAPSRASRSLGAPPQGTSLDHHIPPLLNGDRPPPLLRP